MEKRDLNDWQVWADAKIRELLSRPTGNSGGSGGGGDGSPIPANVLNEQILSVMQTIGVMTQGDLGNYHNAIALNFFAPIGALLHGKPINWDSTNSGWLPLLSRNWSASGTQPTEMITIPSDGFYRVTVDYCNTGTNNNTSQAAWFTLNTSLNGDNTNTVYTATAYNTGIDGNQKTNVFIRQFVAGTELCFMFTGNSSNPSKNSITIEQLSGASIPTWATLTGGGGGGAET